MNHKPERRGLSCYTGGNKPMLNLLLFILTVFSTWLVGGPLYALAIISILFAHEMGHYLMCRKYRIKATLPFFIPFPFPSLNPFGTLGAVIKIKEPIPDRIALFDLGIAGPLAGLAVTIPALVIGLGESTFIELETIQPGSLNFGTSLLFSFLAKLVLGSTPEGYDLMLHPFAFAGWTGLFVTSLNLIPIGQLDGGHVLYTLSGKNASKFYKLILALFALSCALFYPGWMFFILLLIWLGYKHPPPLNDHVQIGRKRRILGYITFVIFIISFVPVPIYFSG